MVGGLYIFMLVVVWCNVLEARSRFEADKYWYDQLQSLESKRKNNNFFSTQNKPAIREVVGWANRDIFNGIKQVTGVAVDQCGDVHIFHRGDREWDASSFDVNGNYLQRDLGPIDVSTVYVLDRYLGKFLRSWGKNRFYLPHGITVDSNGNTWVTDVALHQVMKFSAGNELPSLVLGKEFEPGSDMEHFCKPSDVAVLPSGYFFVSDGYCNSRIMMFKPDGNFHKEIGAEDNMVVPHSLSLVEDRSMLCVADRENARILCYPVDSSRNDTGTTATTAFNVRLGPVYAIDGKGNHLFAVTGPKSQGFDAQGLTIDLNSGNLLSIWTSAQGFSMPHDLAVSPDGCLLYVADAAKDAPTKVSKFQLLK